MKTKWQNILLVAIVVLLLLGGVWLFFQQKQINKIRLPFEQAQETKKGDVTPQSLSAADAEKLKGEMADKFDKTAVGGNFVNGRIASVKDDTLSLEVISAKDGKKIGEYIVKVTVNTKISKIEFASPPKVTNIGLGDLKPGDKVAVASKDSLNGRSEFEAASVQLLIAPQSH